MAKQTSDSAAETTTLSTRFNAKQREIVERAANILSCTPAKLIREAAVIRAAGVVNAAGNARASLRALAAKALQPMINPIVEVEFYEGSNPEWKETQRMSIDEWEQTRDEADGHALHHWMDGRGFNGYTVRPVRPDANEIREFRIALRSCALELADFMLEQWEAVESGGQRYQPVVSTSDLLGDDQGDD